VYGADTLSGKRVEIAADLVVLGMAVVPSDGIRELLTKLSIAFDEAGFVAESHAKFHPLETNVPGIFVAGMAQGAKDIPDSVAQGSGAAGRVLTLFAQSASADKALVV
jgi:heterodisulfide reductase subunit A